VLISEIISQVLDFTDNIPASDGDYAARRTRYQNYLREVVAELWYAREWPFARKTDTVTVTAPNGYGVLPDDFLRLGDYGSVLLASYRHWDPLENVPEYEIIQVRNTNLKTETPEMFSIFGFDTASGNPLIQFPYNSADYDVLVSFIMKAPEIDENTNDSALDESIPVQYHQRVIVPGVQSRSLESKGDASWNTYYGRFTAALGEMKANERRRQGTIWQMPNFFGDRRAR
jgi:hypothetical protein